MYHEVYTPERTHSGISLFGLFLQVYTHKDLGGITQSVPTNPNSHSVYSMLPAQGSSRWKEKTNITHEKRREVCRLKLFRNSSTAVCACVCRIASIVSSLLPKRGLGGTGKVLASFSFFVVFSNKTIQKHELYISGGVLAISQQWDMMEKPEPTVEELQ